MNDANKSRILPLTPRNDLSTDPHFRVYKDYLDQAFRNPKIRNIALSGSLGSGKSSILHSYDYQEGKHHEHFLYISLAEFHAESRLFANSCTKNGDFSASQPTVQGEDTAPELAAQGAVNAVASPQRAFQDTSGDATTESGKKAEQKKLEYSLMSQILSRCRQSDLTESSIGGVPEKFRFRCLKSLGLATLCLLVFMLVFHDQFGDLAELFGTPACLRRDAYLWMYAAVGLGITACVLFLLNRFLPQTHVSKLTLKSSLAEAEVILGKEHTSLDLYKFELAHILSKIGEKIDYTVVFEDMERLEPATAIDIMHKLWELNALTNNHIQAVHTAFSREKPFIRFIYAISESIFTAEERTKYFDCIIPIIPALNPLNSREMIISLFIPEVVCDNEYINCVVENLAPLLTDYRMLLDVRNEYLVYRNLYCKCKPGENAQDQLKEHEEATLLAVVAYKALFPQKFEHALSSGGPGILTPITGNDLDQYYGDKIRYSAFYRERLEKGINDLFDKSILDTTCLRMVGVSDAWLLEHWIAMVLSATGCSQSTGLAPNLDALIDVLERSDTSSKLINDFKEETADLASSCEDADKFISLAKCLAAVSRNEVEDWSWFWGDDNETDPKRKQHFTLCFRYLSSVKSIPTHLDNFLKECKLPWFISNLSIMEVNDMNGSLHWSHHMGNILASYLCKYDNFPNRDMPSNLTELVVADNRSLGSYIADNR